MSATWSVIGGVELPNPIRVTSDATDRVNAGGYNSPDGGVTWDAAYGDGNGYSGVSAIGAAESGALNGDDRSAALRGAGTVSTGGATTVSSIALAAGQRLVIRRLLATLGGTTAATAPLVVILGSTTLYTAQVNNGVPCVVCDALAPLVIEGPVGGATVYIKFNTATGANAVYGVVVSAVID